MNPYQPQPQPNPYQQQPMKPGQQPDIPETCCFCIPIDPAVAQAMMQRQQMMGGGGVPPGTAVMNGPCPVCAGMGHFDKFDKPCRQTDMMRRDACRACQGRGQILSNQPQAVCTRCGGKGGIDAFNKGCLPGSMHHRRDCEQCQGRGLIAMMGGMGGQTVVVVNQQPPIAGTASLMGGLMGAVGMAPQQSVTVVTNGANPAMMQPVMCPICSGQGNFDQWGKPCQPQSPTRKAACHACQGQRFIQQQPFTVCMQCTGKGGFGIGQKPCMPTDMMFKQTCQACGGRGLQFAMNGNRI